MQTVANLVGASWRAAEGPVEEIPNPATGEIIAQLPHATAAEIDAAVAAAADAQRDWADRPVPDRAQALFRFKTVLEDHLEELAAIITAENGKTLAESRGDVRRGIDVVDFSCGAATLLQGAGLDQVARGIDTELTRFPVGVVAGITPFNFPVMIPLWMMAPALASGNAFVLKPSQRTPLSAVRLVELAIDAGIPAGAVQLVHGAKDAVDRLLTNPAVDAVSFVGSAPVAKYVYQTGGAAGKRVQALGGAKNHLIVMDDAELDPSVEAVASSAFGMAGQRCLAGSVAIGVGRIGDALGREIAAAADDLVVGPGTDPKTQMGPVIRDDRRRELAGYIEHGESTGASLLRDGRDLLSSRGFFLGPTVFDRVAPRTHLWTDELFGPILSVARADDLDGAIELVNSSTFGNMASIFTRSGIAARTFKRRAEAGMIGVNIGVAAPMAFFPFSGWKGSFYGDLHVQGTDGFRFYTRTKVTTTRWFGDDVSERLR
jgi:malonate-semialdehyde dehydrogenase (acetylating) / methylmalonate-semialdehyde dehydrogenase